MRGWWATTAGTMVGIASISGMLAVPAPIGTPADEAVDVVAVEPATIAGPRLVFASFNVCKVDCAPPAPPWTTRRERVARVINESGADVIGLQEATNNATPTARTQADDITALAAAGGYRSPVYPPQANECRRPRDVAGQLAGPSPCDNTALLLFRPPEVEQVELPDGQPSAGIVLTSSIVSGLDPASAVRSVAWAYLRGTNGTGPFLAISLHTDSAKTAEAEGSRIALGAALDDWVTAWNAAHGMDGVAAVLMADLNSYRKRQPHGVQAVLVEQGWTDAATAPVTRNVQYSTINDSPLLGLAEQGFPVRPHTFRATRGQPVPDATRIDYVMTLGRLVAPLDYEVVIRLNPDGTFLPDYQASDHQMVRATLAFEGPAAG